MKTIAIVLVLSIGILLITILQKSKEKEKEGYQTVPTNITSTDNQLVSLSNAILSSTGTYSTLLNRRKIMEEQHITAGGTPVPYPSSVMRLMKTIRPQ